MGNDDSALVSSEMRCARKDILRLRCCAFTSPLTLKKPLVASCSEAGGVERTTLQRCLVGENGVHALVASGIEVVVTKNTVVDTTNAC